MCRLYCFTQSAVEPFNFSVGGGPVGCDDSRSYTMLVEVSAVNWDPLSEVMVSGYPKMEKISLKAWMTLAEVMSLRTAMTGYLE